MTLVGSNPTQVCFTKWYKGSIAQLVQSIGLLIRGSRVRVPVLLPYKNTLRVRASSVIRKDSVFLYGKCYLQVTSMLGSN